ncbi:MAG: amidohydrolase family protein [Planctomycetota bacterium]
MRRIAPGQFADLTVLSDDYFSVDEEQIKQIESVLTMIDGRTTYAAEEFAELDPELPKVSPAWSPVAHFGGYARRKQGNVSLRRGYENRRSHAERRDRP